MAAVKVKGTFTFKGEQVHKVEVPIGGKASDAIVAAREECNEFMKDHLQKNNESTAEVDVLEEVISDGEEGGKDSKGKGKQRTKGQQSKRTGGPAGGKGGAQKKAKG